MMMIKSNGSGAVENVVFEKFIDTLLSNRFTDNLTDYATGPSPPPKTAAGSDDVTLTNITFPGAGWTSTEADGATRGPVRIASPNTNPCTDITIDFAMWTEAGDTQWYLYESACGSRFRLK
ncbi:Pectin lyase fold/virulence factor [Penicillium occitanis (nom. inval.)]|nr:Pectin lyase fold/virulence factor [Penicillium occitanis (nom. inval.)]PCG98133.1 hypothetical protein PENOC_064540 [Penicillium occitanis (nom. inval.)]